MKKYTKKELQAMTTLSDEIAARLHNLQLDRLQIMEIGEWLKNPTAKKELRQALLQMNQAISEAREIVKGVR
jgi:hypothetical protein